MFILPTSHGDMIMVIN